MSSAPSTPSNFAAQQAKVRLWRTIIALNVVSGLTQIGQYGIAFPLVALWLDAHSVPPWLVGLLAAMPWCGMLLGIIGAPRLMRAWSPRLTVSTGIFICALATLALPFMPLALWMLPCFMIGLGLGLRWIGNESWLYAIVPGERRGRVVGIHETVIGISLVLGPALIATVGLEGLPIFAIGAAFGLAALLPLFAAQTPMPAAMLAAPQSWRNAVAGLLDGAHRSPAMVVGFLGGVADTSLLALLPLFFGSLGVHERDSALLVGVFGFGGLICQYPLGMLSDHYGVRRAIQTCAVGGIVAALALLLIPHWVLWPAIFLIGGVGGGLLTLSIVAATESAADSDQDMSAAISRASLSFTIGSIAGPPLTGVLMQWAGAPALPVFIAAVSLLLLGMQRRQILQDMGKKKPAKVAG